MDIFKKNEYYEEQFEGMCEWVKLLQRISTNQKLRVYIEGQDEPEFEGEVIDISFIRLNIFASYGSGGIVDIAAKDDVIIITLQEHK